MESHGVSGGSVGPRANLHGRRVLQRGQLTYLNLSPLCRWPRPMVKPKSSLWSPVRSQDNPGCPQEKAIVLETDDHIHRTHLEGGVRTHSDLEGPTSSSAAAETKPPKRAMPNRKAVGPSVAEALPKP